MLKLLKYEFRKTWYTKAILLVLTLIAQAGFLIGVFADKETPMILSIVALGMLSTFGIMAIGLMSLMTFHQDLNTKQSYMLFMTPHSSYKILGAKVLENGLSILLGGVFFSLLGLADIGILSAHEGDLMLMADFFKTVIEGGQDYFTITPANVIMAFSMLLANWLLILTTAFFAIVLSATFFAGRKFSGLLSFVIFLLVDEGLTRLIRLVRDLAGNGTFVWDMAIYTACALVLTIVVYIVTGWIMEKKLSV